MDSGAKMDDLIFEDPAEFNTFSIPTDQMAADRKYELRISAISREDSTPFSLSTTQQGERTTEIVHEFSFDPSSIYPSAAINSVIQEGSDLILNISLTNPNMIGGFDGWLVDEATNTQVKESGFNISKENASGGRIVIPTRDSRLPSGKYSVILRVLNAQNEVMTATEFKVVTYKAPGLVERLTVALTAKPIFLAIIAGIVMLVVVFLMILSARQKSVSSTPVMQGQLGKKMKGKELPDGLQAIASDEGVLLKKSPRPAVPHQAASQTPKAAPAVDATIMYNTREAPPATVVVSQPMPQKAFLTALKGASGTWLIDQTPFIIGRTEGNLVLNEGSISRKHAQINCGSTQSDTITDLNSSNGTKLNGRRLNGGETAVLANGSIIELGPNISLRFEKK
jgi:hypothetical protein